MHKGHERPLANYELPFLPLPSFQLNTISSKQPAYPCEGHTQVHQFQVKARGRQIENEGMYSRPKYLTVLSYNVWFEEHNIHVRFPAILRLLEQASADFICLQEVTPKFLHLLASLSKHYFMPESHMHWYDTLILSRYPCRFYRKPFANSQMERSNLTAVVEFCMKDTEKTFKVGVSCVHLESSESHGPRMEQLEEVKASSHDMDLSIIAGDFNFSDGCPENEAIGSYTDVWKTGKRHFSKWATEEMKASGFTMPAHERSPAVRLDHVIYRRKSKAEREEAEMEMEEGDELAIIGDFTIPYYEEDHFSQIFHDFLVRTPSDHFGLIAKIVL